MTVRELRAKAADCVADAEAIYAKAKEEGRDLKAEERESVDKFIAQSDEYREEADRLERLEQARANQNATANGSGAGERGGHGDRGSGDGEGDGGPRGRPRATYDDPNRFRGGSAADDTGAGTAPAQARDRVAESWCGYEGRESELYRDVAAFALDRVRDSRLDRLRNFAAAEGIQQAGGADGGFLVPDEMSRRMFDLASEDADSLLGRVDRMTVTGESITIPGSEETSRKDGGRHNGILGGWKHEVQAMVDSHPQFGERKLEPQELYVFAFVTDKMLRNSPVSMQSYIEEKASKEIAFQVGRAIFNGTGAGQPKGILKSGALVVQDAEATQPANSVRQANLARMWARLLPRAKPNAVWFICPDVQPELDLMSTLIRNEADDDNVAGYEPRLYNPERNTIKGRPIIELEYCPALGEVGDILLADMRGYVAGVKGGVHSAVSMHLKFDTAQTAFRFIFEIDGQTWRTAPVEQYQGANTRSDFVTLAARAG